ncbi:MAG: DEAD/DEAH box helicase [Candidatus Pacebacteria bacterium]|nr:DEAD/DEAH box helicase [Candidatus Paceibacterota bacterium]
MEKQTFEGLNIRPEILGVLGKLNFSTPTPIQSQAIPVAIKDNDVIGIAQTGTGKTLAFGVPTIQKLMDSKGLALIILPTRELALQVDESLSKISRNFNLRSVVLIGGQNMNKQLRDLRANPRIIISTPGRLIDHLERKTVRLEKVEVLVLDEADRMLDMGFEPQIKRILQSVPQERQTMLFSATMPAAIVNIANRYMKTPLRVEVAPAGSATENVTHEIFFVKDSSKLSLLESVLKDRKGSVLVFSRTKHGAKRIAFALRKMEYTSTEIHSNRTLAQRMSALEGFKKGRYQVMVATDIAARGIDVKGIELVINYDLPDSPEDYVHRIGRTGRAENLGHAISFATPRQAHDVRIIERLIKKELPISKLPELAQLDPSIKEELAKRESERGQRGRDDNRRSPSSESRGHSASGSRYGRSAKPADTVSREKREVESNPRRGFLPKRSNSRPYEKTASSLAQKGKDFYKDFNKDSFFESSDYKKSDSKDERTPRATNRGFQTNHNEGANRKSYGHTSRPNHNSSNRRGYKDSKDERIIQPAARSAKRISTLEEGQQDSYVQEPFMNANKKPDYRKPFGTYKSTQRGKGGNSRAPFNKGPRKTAARTSR